MARLFFFCQLDLSNRVVVFNHWPTSRIDFLFMLPNKQNVKNIWRVTWARLEKNIYISFRRTLLCFKQCPNTQYLRVVVIMFSCCILLVTLPSAMKFRKELQPFHWQMNVGFRAYISFLLMIEFNVGCVVITHVNGSVYRWNVHILLHKYSQLLQRGKEHSTKMLIESIPFQTVMILRRLKNIPFRRHKRRENIRRVVFCIGYYIRTCLRSTCL